MAEEQTHERIIVSYNTYRFEDTFWQLDTTARADLLKAFCEAAAAAGERVFFYQVSPARAEYDLLVWTTRLCEDLEAPDRHFGELARRLSPFRGHINMPLALCGIQKTESWESWLVVRAGWLWPRSQAGSLASEPPVRYISSEQTILR